MLGKLMGRCIAIAAALLCCMMSVFGAIAADRPDSPNIAVVARKGLSISPASLRYDPEQWRQVGYGSYLVNSVIKCGACHSSGAEKADGSARPGYMGGKCSDSWCSADLTPDYSGKPGGYDLRTFLALMHYAGGDCGGFSDWGLDRYEANYIDYGCSLTFRNYVGVPWPVFVCGCDLCGSGIATQEQAPKFLGNSGWGAYQCRLSFRNFAGVPWPVFECDCALAGCGFVLAGQAMDSSKEGAKFHMPCKVMQALNKDDLTAIYSFLQALPGGTE